MSNQKDAMASVLTQDRILPRSYQDNIVDSVYKIDTTTVIHELNNEFCQYYNAVNVEDQQEYFAIVFDKSFIPNIHDLQIFKSSNFEGLNNVLTYSIVKISTTESYHLVAIVEKYNFNHTLDHYIVHNNLFSFEQVEIFIERFTKLLEQLERMHITCGNLNPSNIILLEDNSFLLRETIISYPHFYQEAAYIAPEIAECTESGRTTSLAADIYALSVTAFFALTGKKPWLEYENIYVYNEERFEQTTFKLLFGKRKISEYIKLFFRWTLRDNPEERWQTRHIFDWLAGKTDKASAFEKITESNNPIAFNERNYNNTKSISYAFFFNWSDALTFINDERLFKWFQRNNSSSSLIDVLQELLSQNTIHLKSLYGNERNWKLTNLLAIIDPSGSIRQDGIAVTPSSIPIAIHYLNSKNRRVSLDYVIRAVKEKYWLFSNKLTINSITPELENEFLNVSQFFSLSSPMFSIERVIYSLNPYAICFSPMVVNEYIFSLRELLKVLDIIAMEKPEKLTIDRHIIAFIAAKISLKHESDVKILNNFPAFSEHHLIHGLCILSLAQQHESNIAIPNLCNFMLDKICAFFLESVHNIHFKEKLVADLKESAKDGKLSQIVDRIRSTPEFLNDYNGYYHARREVEKLKKQIQILRSEDEIFDNAIFLGQKLTVLVSYVLCCLVTIILMI